MIRKVPNMSAWVMQAKDYRSWIWTSAIHVGFQLIFSLPLFEVNPSPITQFKDELILVIDAYFHHLPYTLEQIEKINKTWNLFYE